MSRPRLCYHERVIRAARIGLVCLALVAAACSKAGEEAEAKRSPISPPPPSVELPADLRIPVQVDGRDIQVITTADLAAAEPDFSDTDRRAWRLVELLGDRAPAGTRVEAIGEGGVGISMSIPASEGEPQPVLFLTRRGDLVAAAVRADDPFPDYHGQGGRLRRPGDPLPRLTAPVVKLVLVPPADRAPR